MRRLLKDGFLYTQRHTGRVATRAGMFRPAPDRLPIFLLHSLSAASSDTALDPGRFRDQLQALLGAGFQCVSLADALANMANGRAFATPSFALTFDDGYANNLDPGARILNDLGLCATLFVTTDFIDGRIAPPWHAKNPVLDAEFGGQNRHHFGPLDWAGLRDLATSGCFDIGSHSVSHRMMGLLPENALVEELTRSRETLEDRLGRTVNLFSYPYGVRRYGAYSQTTERHLQQAGYACSCTSEIGRARTGNGPWQLPRIPLVTSDSPMDAVAKASGGYDWVAVAQATYQRVFGSPHTT